MFNLLVSYDPKSWDLTPYKLDKSRVAIEYTDNEISERYKFLEHDAIKELMSFPALFATEGESSDSRIGYINKIKIKGKFVIVEYEFDPDMPPIPAGTIKHLMISLDIGRFEMNRTGSMSSTVGPAVTSTFMPASVCGFRSSSRTGLTMASGSAKRPSPYSPHAR